MVWQIMANLRQVCVSSVSGHRDMGIIWLTAKRQIVKSPHSDMRAFGFHSFILLSWSVHLASRQRINIKVSDLFYELFNHLLDFFIILVKVSKVEDCVTFIDQW